MKSISVDLIGFAGIILLLWGIAQIYIPAAFIVSGLSLLALAVYVAMTTPPKANTENVV